MATYLVTLQHGLGKTGKARSESRKIKINAPDSKTPSRSPKVKDGRRFWPFRTRTLENKNWARSQEGADRVVQKPGLHVGRQIPLPKPWNSTCNIWKEKISG